MRTTFMVQMLHDEQHSSHNQSTVCEQCCYEIVSGGNSFSYRLSEWWLSVQCMFFAFWEDLLGVFKPSKKSGTDAEEGRAVRRGGGGRGRAVSRSWLNRPAEIADDVIQIMIFAFTLLGGFCAGAAAIIMAFCPSTFGSSSGSHGSGGGAHKHDDKHDDRDDHESYAGGGNGGSDREDEKDFWNDYNKGVHDINDMGKKPFWDTDNDVLKDDQLIGELNSTMRAVEDGKEDPRKLKELQDEVYRSRDEKNRKDAKRDMLHSKFLDAQAKSRRLFDMAAIANKNQDYAKADSYASEGESAWREAQGIMRDLQNV